MVPRIRTFSDFATQAASGEFADRIDPAGSDELAELGRVLNEWVDRQAADREYEGTQAEFIQALQVAENEDEAHDILKRHLERSIPDSTAVVFQRNNSANRLQAATGLPPDSALLERLPHAPPRACLAVRFSRHHVQTAGREDLVICAVCGSTATSSACFPLLVGGEVIGSVLVEQPKLSDQDARRIGESVAQAAPVLANLRNLRIAEQRALTDALTGLANQRAAHDTLRRMVAQASRQMQPLAVILLDLDHFKQINDAYGHDKGDDVLAAVGTVLKSSIRASDFAARYGGEEFLLLLPQTEREGATTVAGHIRIDLAAAVIRNVDRRVTASFGIAVLPDDAVDAPTLIRRADRALYAAKKAGRDRIAFASQNEPAANLPEDKTVITSSGRLA